MRTLTMLLPMMVSVLQHFLVGFLNFSKRGCQSCISVDYVSLIRLQGPRDTEESV